MIKGNVGKTSRKFYLFETCWTLILEWIPWKYIFLCKGAKRKSSYFLIKMTRENIFDLRWPAVTWGHLIVIIRGSFYQFLKFHIQLFVAATWKKFHSTNQRAPLECVIFVSSFVSSLAAPSCGYFFMNERPSFFRARILWDKKYSRSTVPIVYFDNLRAWESKMKLKMTHSNFKLGLGKIFGIFSKFQI